MSENRFYTDSSLVNEQDGILRLTKDESNHAVNVLRLSKGDKITVLDGKKVYKGKIVNPDPENVEVKIDRISKPELEVPRVIVYQGLPKGKKPEFIVEKLTELGIDEIIFFESERSISKISKNKSNRIKRIAISAVKQSGRGTIPEIKLTKSLQISETEEGEQRLLFSPGSETDLKSMEKDLKAARKITTFVGPEGGFTDKEINKIKNTGAGVVKLESPVLRSETAALVAATLTLYVAGRL